MNIKHAMQHAPGTVARATPHVLKHIVCCGLLPFLATATGIRFLELQQWQEYAFAATAAVAITAVDDAWHRRKHRQYHEHCTVHKIHTGRTVAKYAGWALFAMATTWAVHAAGFHPHHEHDHAHTHEIVAPVRPVAEPLAPDAPHDHHYDH
jgi:hypothetical protein